MRDSIVLGGQLDAGISKCALKKRKSWVEQMNREPVIFRWTSIHNWPFLLFVLEVRNLGTS